MTRLLDGLERQGYVERAACASDRRVVYAVLDGRRARAAAQRGREPLGQVDAYFGARLESDELASLTQLLDRLGEGELDAADCST